MEENKKLKWNFLMGVIHGTFFTAGQAFGSQNTILPVFLNTITSSKTIIGSFFSTINIFGVIPQLFVANKLENKIIKISLLRKAIFTRALCWGILTLITYFFAKKSPNFVLFSTFFLLSLFTFMGGIATIPFMDIWGKAIPPNLRGRFFGLRQVLGGTFAIAAGFVAKSILGNKQIIFPYNYSLLFLLAFIFISISYLGLGSVKEPIEEVHKDVLPFKDFLKKGMKILKKDANYRKFLTVQILTGANGLALPFYVLYAKNILKVNISTVGIFLSVQTAGMVLSNILWAHLSDFHGNKKVIQITSMSGFVIPFLAIITKPSLSKIFILLFITIGIFTAGSNLGKTNFLLDISKPKERPIYVGLNNTLTFPITLFPFLGGVLIHTISYKFLFELTFLIMLSGFLLSLKLEEPRKIEPEN